MPIKIQCGKCKSRFNVKDEWAGKRAKCPKCQSALTIPTAPTAAHPGGGQPASPPQTNPAPIGAAAMTTPPQHNPLLDLLQEAGVQSAPQGPVCPSCAAEMTPDAMICIECGYNIATGEQIQTQSYEDEYSVSDPGQTDADRIMAKAEREIEEMPVSAFGQNFGDGIDSFLIAGIGFVIFLVLVAIGVGVIYLMDLLGDLIDPAKISFFAAIGLYLLCVVWISIIGFLSKPVYGVLCLATGGLFCFVFAFMQSKGLLLPVIIQLVAVLIGLVSYWFAFAPEDKIKMGLDGMQMAGETIFRLLA